MSTFDPVISPWLAAGSCVGFTFMFVGSLYVFPLKTKQERERDRYVPVPVWDVQTGTDQENSPAYIEPLSPRLSSSSSVSACVNTTTVSNTNAIVITKKVPTKGIADNRAHRSSTHLQFIDTTSTTSTCIASPRTSASALTLGIPSPSSTTFSASPASASASASASSTSATASVLSSSGSVARPEVVIHPHTTSHNDQSPSRYHSPVGNQKLDRDHPLVIIQRFKGIVLTCVLVPLYLWWLFSFSHAMPADLSFWERLGHFLRLLGISIPNNILKLVNHTVIPLFLVSILFMGPVLMMFLSNELPFQQAFDWASHRQHLKGLIGIRNFVVGPISEEFIFRACMVTIMAHSGVSVYAMILGIPLVFGIAHLHHGYESYQKNGRTRRAFLNAALNACLQLAYTTLFGWFATYLFLRTSNLLGPCLCHIFCNVMGFPDITNIQYYGRWKKWLYTAYLTGILLFGILLRPLTNPPLYGDVESSAYWSIFKRTTNAVEA